MDNNLPEKSPAIWKRLIDELIEGREFANQLQSALSKPSDGGSGSSASSSPEDLVVKIMKSFSNTLFMLKANDGDDDASVSQIQAHYSLVDDYSAARKSEDSGESSRSVSNAKDRRGCYKRRRTSPIWENETPNLIDDGYAWRKYGQKVILNAQYPRSYYRCTHKFEQGCRATKQVQRIQEDPQLYRATYHGHHTCNNHLIRSPELILDLHNPTNDPPNHSSTFISFSDPNPKKHAQDHPLFSAFPLIKQEEEMPCDDDDDINHNQASSSDYFVPFKQFESQPTTAVLSSSLDTDHDDVLSGVIDSLDFDDELQFEF